MWMFATSVLIKHLKMTTDTKSTRGVRQGTKRAPYATKKIETVTINFRVPKSLSEACKDFVRPLLKEFLNKKR